MLGYPIRSYRILTKFAPFESPQSQFSNGANFDKIRCDLMGVNQPAQWGPVIKFRNFAIGFGAALFSDIFKTKNELGKLFFVFFCCIISKPKLGNNILGGNFESQINKKYYFRDNLGTQINKI